MDKDSTACGFINLQRQEYKTAEKVFSNVLKDEPDNSAAVVGLFMSQYRFSNTHEFNLNKLLKIQAVNDLSFYKSQVGDEYSSFFGEFEAVSENVARIKENRKLEEKLKTDNKRYDMRREAVNRELPNVVVRFYTKRSHIDFTPRTALAVTSVILALIVIVVTILTVKAVFFTADEMPITYVVLGFIPFVLDLFMFILSLAKVYEVRKLEKELAEVMRKTYDNNKELRRISDEISEDEKEISRHMVAAKAHFAEYFGNRFSGKDDDSDNEEK